MKLHDQRDELIRAIELALPYLGGAPTLAAFGIAREDCALVHIDYFGGIEGASSVLTNALAEVQGRDASDVYRELPEWSRSRVCDCRSCAGEEAHAEAVEKHRAAYTNVAAWKPTERTEKMNDVERIARIVYDTAIAPRAPFAATEASKYENVKDELEATVAALLTKGTGD